MLVPPIMLFGEPWDGVGLLDLELYIFALVPLLCSEVKEMEFCLYQCNWLLSYFS